MLHKNILTIWSIPIWLSLIKIQNYTSLSELLHNNVIIQSLTHHICWITRIFRNINSLLVPCSGLFPWGDLTSIHMSWKNLYSYLHHAKDIWTGQRVYMDICINLGMCVFGYGQSRLITQSYQKINFIGNTMLMSRSMSYFLVMYQHLF